MERTFTKEEIEKLADPSKVTLGNVLVSTAHFFPSTQPTQRVLDSSGHGNHGTLHNFEINRDHPLAQGLEGWSGCGCGKDHNTEN